MRVLAVIVTVVLLIALIVLALLTYVTSRRLADERARGDVEAQQARELSTALDVVLQENEELRASNAALRESNTALQRENHELQAQQQVLSMKLQQLAPGEELEFIRPGDGAVLDNGRSDRKDYIEWIFDWPDTAGATRYNLYVIGGRATIPLIDTETEESAYVHLSLGSYIADRNRLGWTWKVRALVDGDWSEWSAVQTFDVEPLNTDPPVESPDDDVENE